MTMALAVIMIALFSVMGAGLLVFATSDLGIVVDANRGQRAFEMADAGAHAAKRQLEANSSFAAYNGDADDLQWSATKSNTDPNCSGLGGYGVCLNNLDGDATTDDAVLVTIRSFAGGGFRIIATGKYGSARRKVEATLQQEDGVGIPPTYFSRSGISFGGNITATDISLFARGDVTKSGASGSFSGEDKYFKRWAEASGSGSYPNPYNRTARSNSLAAVGATGNVAQWYKDRAPVFDSGTPVRMVENPPTPQPSNRITFPFDTSQATLDADIAALRQRAQELEAQTGYNYYRNGVSGSQTISSWPSGSDYDTVIFYEFSSYSSTNNVSYSLSTSGGCGNSSAKGVIVVVNGNFSMAGSNDFNGGVVTYTKPTTSGAGTFSSSGGSCLTGYANSTGGISVQGNPGAGSVPALNTLPSFDGNLGVTGWRELYD